MKRLDLCNHYHRLVRCFRFASIVLLLGGAIPAAQAQAPVSGAWSLPSDAKWDLQQGNDADATKAFFQPGSEKGVGEFHFGFLGNVSIAYAYNQFLYRGDSQFSSLPKQVTFQIKDPTGVGQRAISLRFQDAAGTTFHWNVPMKSSAEWETYRVELKQGVAGFSAWNPKVRDDAGKVITKTFDVVPPVKLHSIIINRQQLGDNSSGVVLLKGLIVEK